MIRAALILAALALSAPAQAQDIFGLTPGAPAPEDALSTLPAPAGSGQEGVHVFTGWQLEGGNGLSITEEVGSARVLYIETWWGGDADHATTPIEGLVFGQTTLADLHARFGSAGMFFDIRGSAAQMGDNAVFFTSYEIEDSDAVLSFVTILPVDEAEANGPGAARLDAIILGFGPYLDAIWGVNRGLSDGYSRIPDPT